MQPTGFNTEIESVLLTTLVTVMPTNARWLRRLRFLLLIALLIRAWMHQQAQSNYASAMQYGGYVTTSVNPSETNGKKSRGARKKTNA